MFCSRREGYLKVVRIALLQIDTTAGDLPGNASLIIRGVRQAQFAGADLVVTPELSLMGYLPRDLLMNRGFVARRLLRTSCGVRTLAPDGLVRGSCPASLPGGWPVK
jgi:hypothetical protein